MSVAARIKSWADDWNPYDPAKLPPGPDGIEPILLEESSVRRTGLRIVLAFFIAFVIWAATAPLDAGVVVPGSVGVSGSRKAVQHPSGGVVTAILVKEGARVEQGQVVLRINPLNSEANLSAASSEYIKLLATESRLLAERAGTEISWAPELDARADDPSVSEAKYLQSQLLRSRRVEFESQQRILESTAASLKRVASEKRMQLELVSQETASMVELAKEGYVPEARANEMRRAKSNLEAEMARLNAEVSSTTQQLAQLRSGRMKEIDNELSEIQKNRESFQLRVQSLDFERNLTEVKSPASGVIVGMQIATVGGVITAGQVLMEIVPEDASLIVKAQVPPNLIDKVRVGLAADMRFSAFNQTTTPVIPGIVKLVSADKLVDPTLGEHYPAQVEITEQGKALLEDKRIQPGMPVEVVIKSGERTFLQWLMKPISDKFARAFKD
jgi:protease secretion system membrane fusion protein